ncbi:MAG: hypothetical protein AB7N80_04170 [Bdellovibrionales bacterium]
MTANRKIFGLILLLIPILTLLHYSDGIIRDRQFINYDDLGLIKPMLDKPFTQYFSEWLPDRNHHAYPLRDVTYFIDQWLSEQTGIPFYWITQIALLVATLIASARLLQTLLPQSQGLVLCLLLILALHPLNIEIVQWLMSRKHLMALLFLWFATAVVFARARQHAALSKKEWWLCATLYLASLLSFPTGLLWMPWALWMQRQELQARPKVRLILWACAGFCIALYLRLTTTGEADYGNSLTSLLMGEKASRTVFFTWNSLGRGFWNLLFPFQLAPFYNEGSILTGWGILALFFCTGAWFRLVTEPEDRRMGRDLSLLIGAILGPSALVFLGFPDFVWADRYGFTILPAVLALLGLALKQVNFQEQKKFGFAIALLTIWLVASVGVTAQRVPLWRNAITLMSECARHEQSPKCVIQTAQREIHQRGCGPIQDILEIGRKIFPTRSPHSTEFGSEMPFYDAICIALAKNISPDEKLQKLPYLFDQYAGAGEIMFSIILAQLQAGRIESAFSDAKSYFLNGDPRPLISARNTINIYRGASQALCELVKNPDCLRRRHQFLASNRQTPLDKGYINWGYNLIMTMANAKKE